MSEPQRTAKQRNYSKRRRRKKQPRTYWIDQFTPREYLYAFLLSLLIGGLTYFYYWRGLEPVNVVDMGVVTRTSRPVADDDGNYTSDLETTKGHFIFAQYVYPFEGEVLELRHYSRGGYKICSAKNDVEAQISILDCVSIPESLAKEITVKITTNVQPNDK